MVLMIALYFSGASYQIPWVNPNAGPNTESRISKQMMTKMIRTANAKGAGMGKVLINQYTKPRMINTISR